MRSRPDLRQRQWIFIVVALVASLSLIQEFVQLPANWSAEVPILHPSGPVGGFVYRDGYWRSELGRWLQDCDGRAGRIPVNEKLYSRRCDNDCGGNGVCNRELKTCRCFHGFSGKACENYELYECNNPPSEGFPYGTWRVSICPGFCDKRRALCFCGEGSKYPERPLAESCGFVVKNLTAYWGQNDFETVYANESSPIGWCNVNPVDFYENRVRIKEPCHCKYDCRWGMLCETPTECSCVNQCSGNGICRGGFCQCHSSWFGIDCSIPSVDAPINRLPSWLHPATMKFDESEQEDSIKVISVERRRPLIYIYDLLPEFNNHLLEGRHFKFECVNRIYDDFNATIWSEQLEGSEMALLESLLASPHRTMNGDEADYFYVPVLVACAITRADDAPHLSMAKHMGLRGYFSGDLSKQAYMYIRENFPFWNRSSGRDHLWLFPWDEGACSAPKEIWNSTMLVHWGNTNSKHNHSTTAYWADNWDPIPSDWRGNHPCYDPVKDIVLPAWKQPDARSMSQRFWSRPRKERKLLFYFNGNLGNAFHGRPEETYSMGIRQKVAAEFASTPNKEGKLGRQAAQDVVVTGTRSPDYAEELSSSRFCGVFPGDGWSGRMEDAILHGCIPVIVQDGIHLPFENALDYQSFAVRISEDEIPNLINMLRNISDAEVDSKLAAVQQMWERFSYKDSMLLEARRQKAMWNHNPEWAQEYEKLGGDDVFATLMQILHFKLHNDDWRGNRLSDGHKDWGIPATCRRAH